MIFKLNSYFIYDKIYPKFSRTVYLRWKNIMVNFNTDTAIKLCSQYRNSYSCSTRYEEPVIFPSVDYSQFLTCNIFEVIIYGKTKNIYFNLERIGENDF
jgi:hypothetical protein